MTRALMRVAVSAYCWLTAAYAFTAASAFTFQEVIRPQMLGAGAFSRWHAALYWLWLAVLLIELRRMWRGPSALRSVKRLAITLAVTSAIGGVAIVMHPVLPALVDDRWSMLAGVVALVPVVWLAALDHLVARDYLQAQPSKVGADRRAAIESRWLAAAIASAAFISIVYAVLTPLAARDAFEPDLLTTGLALGLVWNVVDHFVIFCAAFLALAVCARAVAGRRLSTQYAVVSALITAALALIVQRTVCEALGLEGWWSALVAGSCGLAITVTWGASRIGAWAAAGAAVESAVDVFFSAPPPVSDADPRDPKSLRRVLGQALPFVVILAAAWGIGALSRTLDWDFLILRTGVIALWFATACVVLRRMPSLTLGSGWLALVCIAPLAARGSAGLLERTAQHVTGEPTFRLQRVLDRYTIYNPSFRVADAVLRPPVAASGQTAFLQFLRANTAVGSDVTPPALDFVTSLAPADHPPNVFLFVVDSLRPDYLSPYNGAVTFTPRIAEFAADSLVFRNAFARYGGTGLSLPSIWMGGVGVHKQYAQPFWPMNTLEKLLDANHYQRVMSVDVIMEQLLRPTEPPTALDRGVRTMDYRICKTLDEMASMMPADASRPVFGYSLPQDLHVSNIMTAAVPAGEAYPGFHAPYASRVHAIDRCFGTFVDFLKRRGVYDRSIIVLTSDHGEMLGEEGRWGHVYYLFPQILRVPLVMHVPSAVRRDAAADPGAIAFLTDITPTIYAALGYRPHAADPLMGEALIGPDRAASEARRRGDYVAAASYSAVYAAIRRNGRRLYIVDATKGEEFAYTRDPIGVWQRAEVTDGVRTSGQRLIREHVDRIRRAYRIGAPPTASVARR